MASCKFLPKHSVVFSIRRSGGCGRRRIMGSIIQRNKVGRAKGLEADA